MAEIKMSYIFIQKEKHESKTLQEILVEIIDGVVQERNDEVIKADNIDIRYRIIQKRNSKRCFLEMVSKDRINRSIPALQKIDTAIFKSTQQRYYHSIRDYDGISESFCKRLYPKYAEFERKIRSLVLFILTKAYGSDWRTETVSEELLSALQENAHGNISLNETLENMTLDTLKKYLFEKRHVDYPNFVGEKLSAEKIEGMDKEEICRIIEEMRPTSLWERHFEKFGSQEKWEIKISEVHKTRNKVAHQKTISLEEFTTVSRKLNNINADLTHAIEGIREENFTQYSVVDILGSFATLAGGMLKNFMNSQAVKDVVIGFNAKIQEIVKSMTKVYRTDMEDVINSYGRIYSNLNLEIAEMESMKKLNAMAKSFSLPNILENSIASTNMHVDASSVTKAIRDSIDTTKQMHNSFSSFSELMNDEGMNAVQNENECDNDEVLDK